MSDAINSAEQQLEDSIHQLIVAGCDEADIRGRIDHFLELVHTDKVLRSDLGLEP